MATTTNEHLDFDDLDNGDTYDKSEAQKSGDFGDPVPDGRYQCVIEKAWLSMSKVGSKRMLRWQLKIVTGPCKGRVLFHNNMIETPDNNKWLKGDLTVCGMTIHKLNELNDKVSSLVGVALEVQVKNAGKDSQGRLNQNTYFNKVIEIDRAAMADGGDGGSTASDGESALSDNDVPF